MRLRHNIFRSVKAVAPSGGWLANALVLVHDLVGLTVEAAAQGATAVVVYACEKMEVPKAAGAVAVGEFLYFDLDNGVVTTVAGDSLPVAVCTKAAGALDTYVECDFDGTRAISALIGS
jgi:predicted RecA/RadA family phage recombinase